MAISLFMTVVLCAAAWFHRWNLIQVLSDVALSQLSRASTWKGIFDWIEKGRVRLDKLRLYKSHAVTRGVVHQNAPMLNVILTSCSWSTEYALWLPLWWCKEIKRRVEGTDSPQRHHNIFCWRLRLILQLPSGCCWRFQCMFDWFDWHRSKLAI